ncbi:MAG: hypothetical protein KKF58_05815 [Gammaproteobacteria bacterium]|nr:hypothetical protein [Gammaproteobacteria bacterium]MBU1447808.1 hypothetical protein [Gammaproteobacteria bacterium]
MKSTPVPFTTYVFDKGFGVNHVVDSLELVNGAVSVSSDYGNNSDISFWQCEFEPANDFNWRMKA